MTTELVAVVVAVLGNVPHVLTAPETADAARLPSGPLQSRHPTMQAGLRSWVEQQTGYNLKYVEQLYTFADPARTKAGGRIISVSYLGLTRVGAGQGNWVPWYELFPWEDRRSSTALVDKQIAPALSKWVQGATELAHRQSRRQRCDADFGLGDYPWISALNLQRYELLYEAGLVTESEADVRVPDVPLGRAMAFDCPLLVATWLARLPA